jgi:hypothetical protein
MSLTLLKRRALRYCLVLLLALSSSQAAVLEKIKPSLSSAFVQPIAKPKTVTKPFELPLGATYRQAMCFPVLGQQVFQIRILSENLAHLVISGMMTIDEVVPYTVDGQGRLLFALSSKTMRTLKRFKTKLLEVGYDADSDTPYVKVAPYILPALRIRMSRFYEEMN